MLKKLLLATTFVAGLTASANAAVIVIDDFTTDQVVNAATPGQANTVGNRTIALTSIENGGTATAPEAAAVSASNIFAVENGSGDDSVGTVSWNSLVLGNVGVLEFSVVTNNQGTPGADPLELNNVTVSTNLGIIGTYNLGAVGDLMAVNLGSTVGVTSISLAFSGNNEFDVAIGPVSVNTPEPASMALLGAGLVGLGLSRRRKA